MQLAGSCHCGAVTFTIESHTPHPFNRCYCNICRKTNGGGGYAINIMGETDSLRITGANHVTVYRARGELVDGGADSDGLSFMSRHFCQHCGSALWCSDTRWPEWVWPLASAIDTPLPRPPEIVHLMLASAPKWVDVRQGPSHNHFQGYPDESIADWHRRRGLDVS